MTGPYDAAAGKVIAERRAAEQRARRNGAAEPVWLDDDADAPAPERDPYAHASPLTEPPADDEHTSDEQDEASVLRARLVDAASFILDVPESIPALWGDGNEVLWAEGESLMIAGPMGLGKTTLAGLLIRAQLGITGDVLGINVEPRPGRILYLAMDRPRQIARSLARQFTEADRDVLGERLLVWRGPPPVDVARNPTVLTRLADAADADTVYVDSVKDAALGLSEDEVGAGYNRARQHLLAGGREMVDLHHTTKRGAGGGPPSSVTDIYGSAWITNGAGSIVLLSGDPGDPVVEFKHVRAPAEQVGPYQLLHDADVGMLTLFHRTDLVELVKAKGVDGLTARDAACALYGMKPPAATAPAADRRAFDAAVEKARRRLDKLTSDGVLVRVGSGSGRGATTAWFLTERRPPNA